MKTIKHILFPTDFSTCARYAAGVALSLAKHYGAEVHMLHASLLFEDDPNNPEKRFPPGLLEEPEPYVNRRFEDVLQAYAVEGVPVHQVQIRGFVESEAILNYAEEYNIDLIMMGTHGRRGFKRWLLGSVAEEIVRTAKVPVITIKEHGTGDLGNPKNILVPLDFSSASDNALSDAAEMAKQFDAKLQVVHVVEEPFFQDLYGTGLPDPKALHADTQAKAAEILKHKVKAYGDVSSETHVLVGHPAQQLVKFAADHNIDLILMAHRGQTSLPDRILGSVTEHVVRTAECPVYTADIED